MKYKSFFKQFHECLEDGTAELFDTKEPEIIYPRPNAQGIEEVEITKVYFCNKYMKRCSSHVCAKERGIILDKRKK